MSSRKNSLSVQGIGLYESKHTEGDSIEEHHHQVYQILYALENEGEVTLNGESFNFNQDHVAVIAPYSNHSIISDSKLTVLVLEFEETILDASVRERLLYPFFNQSKLIELNLFDAGELRQLLRKMLYEQSHGKEINLLAMKIFLSELLLTLARSLQEPQMMDANILRAERLRNYIDSHYFEIITSNDISAKLGISTRHINNIFKEQYKMTPMQYLTGVRMERVRKMLIETEKDIVSICFEVGFESLSTFYRTFKNATRMSPNKYRTAHEVHNINKDL